MPNRNKQKGNRVERELVNYIKEFDLEAKRAYASNGLSLGHSEETDVLVEDKYRVQVKAKKAFPKWLTEAQNDVDWVVFKENGKPFTILLQLEDFLDFFIELEMAKAILNKSYKVVEEAVED